MTPKELWSVSAAFARCTEMFSLWELHKDELPPKYPRLHEGIATDDILIQPAAVYLILGIALLHAVLEYFIETKKMEFPKDIQEEVNELYPKTKEFRNCVFHIQDEILSPRQFALMETPYSLAKIEKIHRGLDLFFRQSLRELPDYQ